MNRFARLAVATAVMSMLGARSGEALAQEAAGSPGTAVGSRDLRSGIPGDTPYWSAGPARPFAAAVFATAGISGSTELDLGYGQPHHAWGGLELSSALSLQGVTTFVGGRIELPFGSLRAGSRYFAAITQRMIPPADLVRRPALDLDQGQRTRYAALDAELNFAVPMPAGKLGISGSAHGFFGVPDGYYFFENSLRAVFDPPFAWRARMSYLVGVGRPATFRVGGLVEAYGNPAREAVWIRTGPAVTLSLTHHLEAVGVAAFTVYSPDDIGLAGADLGQLGLRYRWATGDLWPEFP